MAKARSKKTSKEKATVPAEASKKHSFQDIHAALFPSGPPKAKSIKELKDGIRQYMRKKYTGH
jgi:hypothetical protein